MSRLERVSEGRVWKLGDSIDTNQLAGGGLQGGSPEETLRLNCLRGLRPDFTEGVSPGDIVVAGTNFGCGSSRQTAVQALLLCGVAVVLAETLARIFRRNSIALALPAFSVEGISALAADGDVLRVDYTNHSVANISTGNELVLPTFPPSVEAVYRAGGLSEVILRRLAEQGVTPPGV